jgi:hypothetical protein
VSLIRSRMRQLRSRNKGESNNTGVSAPQDTIRVTSGLLQMDTENYNRLDELYKIIREQIVHEDGLINQRLSWSLVVQGFLLVAFFTVFVANTDWVSKGDKVIPCLFIAAVGLAISLAVVTSIFGAIRALDYLNEFAFKRYREDLDERNLDLQYPPITGREHIDKVSLSKVSLSWISRRRSFLAAKTALLIPVVFCLGWLALLLHSVVYFGVLRPLWALVVETL